MSTAAVLERWIAEQACRDCIVRAAAALDAGDYDSFAAHFTEDAVLMRPNGSLLEGRDAILASYLSRPAGRRTRHLLTNHIVDLHSPTTAHATCTVLLWSANANDAGQVAAEPVATPNGVAADSRQLLGEFVDALEYQDGTWLIAKRIARFSMFREPAA